MEIVGLTMSRIHTWYEDIICCLKIVSDGEM